MATRSETTKAAEKAPEEKPAAAKGDGPANGTRYLNTTTGPIIYDKAGHQVDAADWTPPTTLDAIGKAARQAGHLLPESAL